MLYRLSYTRITLQYHRRRALQQAIGVQRLDLQREFALRAGISDRLIQADHRSFRQMRWL